MTGGIKAPFCITNSRENNMPKVTLTNADGSTSDFFPQSYTDLAVATAIAAQSNPLVAPEVNEVDLLLTDGSTKKFTAAAWFSIALGVNARSAMGVHFAWFSRLSFFDW
jgi:hypothetical protein